MDSMVGCIITKPHPLLLVMMFINPHVQRVPMSEPADQAGVIQAPDAVVCPHCGHEIVPRNPETLQARRLILCSMCRQYFQNPHYKGPAKIRAQKEGAEVTCPKCGHKWPYTGSEKRRITCPRCYRSFPNPLSAQPARPAPEPVVVRCRKCGHSWGYKGSLRDALAAVRCPRCRAAGPAPVQEQAVEPAERAES
jgi:DNA-directed RNA polymerase subunit RPC12/RpoP